ncbi:hypothetical protein [Spirillospora sp. NBC_01491]|uniref:hypothetical protein n=1 Tax=Spirillospora sp. NBC_01491 TaxID=2976007 RepID=UPI002E3796BE|nr:hypothetical protein [Spirillospora sp. NBC_01491]
MPQARTGRVSRRAVLGGTLTLPLLAGCAAEAAAPRTEVPALVGAIASEQDLIASYEAARAAHASLAGRIDPVLARHREHLAVLRRHYVPGSGERADEGGAIPPPRPQKIPAAPREALAVLRQAETKAATARVADAGKVDPALAQLLASIGACEAGHAAALVGAP